MLKEKLKHAVPVAYLVKINHKNPNEKCLINVITLYYYVALCFGTNI